MSSLPSSLRLPLLFGLGLASLLALGWTAPAPAAAQHRSDQGEQTAPSLRHRESPAHPTLAAMSGRYRFVSGQGAIRRAVDAVCDRLDFLTRAFARPILEDRNRPYDRIDLRIDAETSRFVLGPWGPVGSRFGATRSVTNERQERVRVRQLARGERLIQTFTTDQGTRRNVLSLSPDGRQLTIDTRITSPRLPCPIRYRLTYRREG